MISRRHWQDTPDHKRTRGRKWMRLREMVLIEEPVCMLCGQRPSTQVDHKKPVSEGGTDERDNLQGVCYDCHDAKTRNDLGIKHTPRKIGIDGYPIKQDKDVRVSALPADGELGSSADLERSD
jgi:5-methylcytosine-specific restriction enzyme A